MYEPAARVAAVPFVMDELFLWKVKETDALTWHDGVWDWPKVIGEAGESWLVISTPALFMVSQYTTPVELPV